MSLPLARIGEQYEIVAKIKEGGMGEIYKVRHRLLDELRVVKVLHPELVGDVELTERFAREARAAIKLRHPNIVQIFDFTVDESGTGLMVMEYIRGTDLKQLLKKPALPSIGLAIEIARQSLRALGYLHKNGFVHRDVSPDNLMLSHDVEGRPLVKVIDLGIAKRHGADSQLTASGIFLGKFRYASPEHFGAHGSGGIEARSDLYTFGLVLYELLTGRYPIQGESTSQLIAGHLFQPPHDFAATDPDERVPEALRQAVLRTLAKNPDERFASAEELISRLEPLRVDYPLSPEVLEESRRFVTGAAATEAAGEDAPAPRAPAAAPLPEPAEEFDGAEALEALVEEVDALLESGQLVAADQLLFRARESHGPAPELTPAKERLDELFRREVEAEVRELMARAEALGEEGDISRALEVLEKARAAAPAPSTLQQEVDRTAERWRHALDRHRAITELERRLLRMIQQRDFQSASRTLAAARDELAADPAFEPLRRLVARTAAERVEELVQQAGVALDGERFETAEERLREAAGLDPDNTWIESRLSEVHEARKGHEEETRRAAEARSFLQQAESARDDGDVLKARLLAAKAVELVPDDGEVAAIARGLDREHRAAELSSLRTTPLSPGLMKAMTDIEAKRAEGDTLAAWRLLREAIEEYGEIDAFVGLRRTIAEELLDEEEEEGG